MPPKSAKGKGKKGDKGGKDKKNKKPKKVNPKYAGLEFDYELIGNKKRDELETIAVNTQTDLDELRRERILMQMQRDYFNELIIIYLQKIRDCRELPKLTRAMRNAMVDEKEYIKHGFSDKMAGNLDFVVSLNTAASQLRQLKRDKLIKQRMADAWRNIVDEMNELERLARNRPNERQISIDAMEKELDNMNLYYEKANEKQQDFVKTITQSLKSLYSDLGRVDYLDIDWIELHYNQLIYEFLNMMSWRYFMFKYTAVDNVHNILTGIMLMMDHWEQLEEDCRFMVQNLELYAMDTEGLVQKSDAMKLPFSRAKTIHVQLDRLLRGLKTTYKSTRQSEDELHDVQDKYKQALTDFAPIEEERTSFRNKLPFLTDDIWATYQERFKINEYEEKTQEAGNEYETIREMHRSYFKTSKEADDHFHIARLQMQEQQNFVEMEKFQSLRIFKQHDDMARSVRARIRDIGTKGFPAKYPSRPDMIGKRNGMGYGPAGLVAQRTYPLWGTVIDKKCQKKCLPKTNQLDCNNFDDED